MSMLLIRISFSSLFFFFLSQIFLFLSLLLHFSCLSSLLASLQEIFQCLLVSLFFYFSFLHLSVCLSRLLSLILPISFFLSLFLPVSVPALLFPSFLIYIYLSRSSWLSFSFSICLFSPSISLPQGLSLFSRVCFSLPLFLSFFASPSVLPPPALSHLCVPRPPRLSNSFHQCTSASFTHQNNVSRGRQTNVSDSLPSYLTISNRVIYRWKKKVFPCLEHYAEIELTQAVCLFLDERGSFFSDEIDDRQPRDQPTPSHRLMLTHQSSLSEFLKMLTPLLYQMESSCCPLSRP